MNELWLASMCVLFRCVPSLDSAEDSSVKKLLAHFHGLFVVTFTCNKLFQVQRNVLTVHCLEKH